MALQRYEQLPAGRNSRRDRGGDRGARAGAGGTRSAERAAAALEKNLELKRKLLTSLSEVGGTVKALVTELDSMESLLEVLHQNSISLRDPQAISDELDTIVRQSEESDRIVREDGVAAQRRYRRLAGAICTPSARRPAASTRAPDTRNVRTKAKER